MSTLWRYNSNDYSKDGYWVISVWGASGIAFETWLHNCSLVDNLYHVFSTPWYSSVPTKLNCVDSFFFGPSSFIRSRKQKAVIYNAHNCCILYLDYNLKFHMLCNKEKTASQKYSWRLFLIKLNCLGKFVFSYYTNFICLNSVFS